MKEKSLEDIKEMLGRLERNEKQMTERQKAQYARQLKELRKEIKDALNDALTKYMFKGLYLARNDSEEVLVAMNAAKCKAEVLDEIAKTKGTLFGEYDMKKMFDIFRKVKKRFFLETYIPYWVQHCRIVEGVYVSDIIGVAWYEHAKDWAFLGAALGTPLPPTKEEAEAAILADEEAAKAGKGIWL